MKFAGRITWQQQLEREQQWHERLLASGHPAYGLGPTWTGPRSVGDVHFVGDDLEAVGLAHGDPTEPSQPLIHVHATQLPAGQFDDVMAQRSGLFPRGTPPITGFSSSFEQLGHELDIDGQPTAVVGVPAPDGWLVRVHPRPDVAIYIEGHRLALRAFVDEHHLIEVTDLAPYLDGRLSMLRRMRG